MRTPLLILYIFILSGIQVFAQSDWSMVSNNKERTAYMQTDQLFPPLTIDDYFNIYGESVVTYGDIIYITNGGGNNQLTAYDRNQKMELWTFELPGGTGSVGNVPAVDGDLVFIGGQHALGLYALNRHTGAEQWMKPIGSLHSSNAVPDGQGHVFIASQDSFYCLNSSDGSTVWVNDRGGTFTPTLHGENVYINRINTLFVYYASTGDPRWSRTTPNGVRGHILADDGIIYDCKQDQICAYAENAYKYWCYTLPDGQRIADFSSGSAILSDSVLCFVVWTGNNNNSTLYALNRKNGELRWKYNFDTEGISSPSASNGVVYVAGAYQNWLRGIDIMTGELVFEDMSTQYWGQPIITDNRLYALGFNGISVFKTNPSQIEELKKENEIIVYPNPFSERISITLPGLTNSMIEIFLHDLTGVIRIKKEIYSNQGTFEFFVEDLFPGIYFMEVRMDNQSIIEKLLKEK